MGITGMKAPARDGTEVFDAGGKEKTGTVSRISPTVATPADGLPPPPPPPPPLLPLPLLPLLLLLLLLLLQFSIRSLLE